MKIVDTNSGAPVTPLRVRVNRTGRRTYSREYKLEIVQQCSRRNVSVAGVALAHGLNVTGSDHGSETVSACENSGASPVVISIARDRWSVLGAAFTNLRFAITLQIALGMSLKANLRVRPRF